MKRQWSGANTIEFHIRYDDIRQQNWTWYFFENDVNFVMFVVFINVISHFCFVKPFLKVLSEHATCIKHVWSHCTRYLYELFSYTASYTETGILIASFVSKTYCDTQLNSHLMAEDQTIRSAGLHEWSWTDERADISTHWELYCRT